MIGSDSDICAKCQCMRAAHISGTATLPGGLRCKSFAGGKRSKVAGSKKTRKRLKRASPIDHSVLAINSRGQVVDIGS